MSIEPNHSRAALCIAHPGHELRVLQWANDLRPLTFIFTDGSGPDRESRLPSTESVLDDFGVPRGSLFGAFTDRQFYELMLAGDPQPFIDIARTLSSEWESAGINLVAGDMSEGFNTSHDLCRMVVNAAVKRSRRTWGPDLANYEFPLESVSTPASTEGVMERRLTEEEFQEKQRRTVSAYPEIMPEVERVIAKRGREVFMVEYLVPVDEEACLVWEEEEAPYYERYGAKQIGAGHYTELITFRDHLQPLGRALWEWAEDGRDRGQE